MSPNSVSPNSVSPETKPPETKPPETKPPETEPADRTRPDKLIYMANRIAAFFATQPKSNAPDEIADHIRKFWEPRMREAICAYLARDGSGLDPLAREAVTMLAAERATPPSPAA